jgi:hypothetical protein
MPPLEGFGFSGVMCLVATMLATACTSETAQRTPVVDTSVTRESAAMTASEPAAHTLTLDLDVPGTTTAASPVPITLRVTNNGTAPIDLYLRGRSIAFDIVITSAAGDTVWHRLRDAVLDASVQVRVLQPRDSLVLTDRWNQRTNEGKTVPPGEYSVRAFLLTDQPEPITFPTVPLRIAAN